MADTNDVLTLAEARDALDVGQSNSARNAKLGMWVTAVSALLDETCGPIVQRADTNTVWASNPYTIEVRTPIHSVSSITEYTGDTGTALSESVTSGYRLNERPKGTGNYTGLIHRTGGTWPGRVIVAATYGRASSTTTVHPRFKQAAVTILENLWRSEEISVGTAGEFDVPYPTFPASYAVPHSVRDLLGDDWLARRDPSLVGVMFG